MRYLPQYLIGIDHTGLSIASIIYHSTRRSSTLCRVISKSMFVPRSKRENTEGFVGNTKPNLSSACQLSLSQQAYPTICSDYQPSVCSPREAIIQTDQLGVSAAELLISSLGHLEASKPPHVPSHLFCISKWTSLEIFSSNGPLLLQKHHLQSGGFLRYCVLM